MNNIKSIKLFLNEDFDDLDQDNIIEYNKIKIILNNREKELFDNIIKKLIENGADSSDINEYLHKTIKDMFK